MSERLLSVGLDVGTTSTQMILSELAVENKAGSFSVPEMAISERKILYKSKVHFTPLKGESLVDGSAIRELVQKEYALAGVTRQQVDTGAVIITGETSRKENAREVLSALSVALCSMPDLQTIASNSLKKRSRSTTRLLSAPTSLKRTARPLKWQVPVQLQSLTVLLKVCLRRQSLVVYSSLFPQAPLQSASAMNIPMMKLHRQYTLSQYRQKEVQTDD